MSSPDDTFLGGLANKVPSLKSLLLSECRATTKGLSDFIRTCPLLEELFVPTRFLSGDLLHSLSSSCPQLRKLTFGNVDGGTNEEKSITNADFITHAPALMSGCPLLQELHISEQVLNSDVFRCLSTLSNLRILGVHQCKLLEPAEIKDTVQALIRSNAFPALKFIFTSDARGCTPSAQHLLKAAIELKDPLPKIEVVRSEIGGRFFGSFAEHDFEKDLETQNKYKFQYGMSKENFDNLLEDLKTQNPSTTIVDFHAFDRRFPIGVREAFRISECLKGNPHVTCFKIANAELADCGTELLSKAFKTLPNLKEISMQMCEIGNEGAASLAENLKSHPSLETLNVGFNWMDSTGAARIASLVRTCPNLSSIVLGSGYFGSPIGDSFLSDLCESVKQKPDPCYPLSIDLKPSSVTDEGLSIVCSQVLSVKGLRLNLQESRVTMAGVKHAATAMSKLATEEDSCTLILPHMEGGYQGTIELKKGNPFVDLICSVKEGRKQPSIVQLTDLVKEGKREVPEELQPLADSKPSNSTNGLFSFAFSTFDSEKEQFSETEKTSNEDRKFWESLLGGDKEPSKKESGDGNEGQQGDSEMKMEQVEKSGEKRKVSPCENEQQDSSVEVPKLGQEASGSSDGQPWTKTEEDSVVDIKNHAGKKGVVSVPCHVTTLTCNQALSAHAFQFSTRNPNLLLVSGNPKSGNGLHELEFSSSLSRNVSLKRTIAAPQTSMLHINAEDDLMALVGGERGDTVTVLRSDGGGDPIWTFKPHTECVSAIALSGKRILTGDDNNLKLWDIDTQKCVFQIGGQVSALAWNGGNEAIVAGFDCMKILDLSTGKFSSKMQTHGMVTSIAYDEKTICACCDMSFQVWDRSTRKVREHVSCMPWVVSFNGALAAVGCQDSTVRVYDLASGPSAKQLFALTLGPSRGGMFFDLKFCEFRLVAGLHICAQSDPVLKIFDFGASHGDQAFDFSRYSELVAKLPPIDTKALAEAKKRKQKAIKLACNNASATSTSKLRDALNAIENDEERRGVVNECLLAAIEEIALSNVQLLLDEFKADPNFVERDPVDDRPTGETPLGIAVSCGLIDIALSLLHHGARAKHATCLSVLRRDEPLLTVACWQYMMDRRARYLSIPQERQLEMVKGLVEIGGAEVNVTDSCGQTALERSVAAGLASIALYLIEQGAEIKGPLLHHAASHVAHSPGPLLETLLERGGLNVDSKMCDAMIDENEAKQRNDRTLQRTPLHCAIVSQNIEAIKFLIEKGANLNAISNEDGYEVTPLSLAGGFPHMLDILLLDPSKIDLNKYDKKSGRCFLHSLVEWRIPGAAVKYLEIAKAAGVDFHVKDQNGDDLLAHMKKLQVEDKVVIAFLKRELDLL